MNIKAMQFFISAMYRFAQLGLHSDYATFFQYLLQHREAEIVASEIPASAIIAIQDGGYYGP